VKTAAAWPITALRAIPDLNSSYGSTTYIPGEPGHVSLFPSPRPDLGFLRRATMVAGQKTAFSEWPSGAMVGVLRGGRSAPLTARSRPEPWRQPMATIALVGRQRRAVTVSYVSARSGPRFWTAVAANRSGAAPSWMPSASLSSIPFLQDGQFPAGRTPSSALKYSARSTALGRAQPRL